MQVEQDRKALLRKALTALDEMKAKLAASERAKAEPIAVVGMGCRFPGGVSSPEGYWALLMEGRNAVTEVPSDRWDASDFAALNGGEVPTCYGGFLDEVDLFDPHFFGISPREAISLDPQQRMVLEVAWEALERGGIAPDGLRNSLTGVFIGITTNDYSQLTRAAADLDVYMATGGALNAAAGRVAYTLGLQGPCMAIDSACSSSLVAVHAACQSLRLGESDLALAGGVNVLLTPEPFVCFTNWGMMAPDGQCKTFDAAANGFVRAEGCGVVVLKRLADARADGDRVLAVVRGSAVNQDGRSSGFTVPSGLAQQAVVQQAVERAGVAPADVGYVEAHGTGTSLGDPIEVEALGAVLGPGRGLDRPLVLGSVKTNIGHCESASGIAGFIKAVLALQHGQIPPHLNLTERSPRIPWPAFDIEIPTAPLPWPGAYARRIAGVSSFGFSGTNAHVVLEEAPAADVAEEQAVDASRQMLALSAKTEPALKALAGAYAEHLSGSMDGSFADVCYTARVGRAQFRHRLAVIAGGAADAAEKLVDFANGLGAVGAIAGEVPQHAPGVAFLFTGQGAQYVGMGRALYATQPDFRDALDRCDRLLTPLLGRSILALMHGADEDDPLIHQTGYTQPALFALEYAVYEMWRALGVEPAVLMGHSIGELVAACAAGVCSLEDALRLVVARGRLMQALPEGGAMAAVMADGARVERAVEAHGDGVSVAAYNGPAHVVISGTREAVAAVSAALAAERIDVRPLKVSHAFHSALMEPMLEAFRREASAIQYHPPTKPLISNVTGREAGDEVADPAYWVRHVREAVRFEQGMQALWEVGYRVFLEAGPHPVLVGMGQACVEPGAGVWAGTLRRNRPDEEQLLDAIGTLYVAGVEAEQPPAPGARRALLPTYPFQRNRYWVERLQRKQRVERAHPLLGEPIRSPVLKGMLFQSYLSATAPPYLDHHRIHGAVVLPATAYLELGLAAARRVLGSDAVRIEAVRIERPLVLPEAGDVGVQVVVTEEDGGFTFEVFSIAEGDEWVRHAGGTVVEGDGGGAERLEPEALRARLREEHDVATYYEKLREVGAVYGPSFQGVRTLYSGVGEAMGWVELPDEAGSAGAYGIHPALLDACFHVAGLALPASSDDGEKVYVPVAVERFAVTNLGASNAWCWVQAEEDTSGEADTFVCSVHVVDVDGGRVAELQGLAIKQIEASTFAQASRRAQGDWVYELTWQPAETAQAERAVVEPGRWVFLADAQGRAEALAAHFEREGHECTLLRPERMPPKTGAAESEGYRRVVEEMAGHDLRGIVSFWGPDVGVGTEEDREAYRYMHRLVQTAQALAATDVAVPFWVVTSGAYQLEGDVYLPSPAQAALWGLIRSVAQEHPAWRCTLVDSDPLSSDEAEEALRGFLLGSSEEREVAIREGQQFVPRLQAVEVEVDGVGSGLGTEPFRVGVSEQGSLENLVFQPAEFVPPQRGEVAIRMHATGLNFRDVLNVLGMYPGDAGLLGLEGAGTVVSVGEGVTAFKPGDAVLALASGAFGTFVATPHELVVRMPDGLSFEEAATTPVAFLTACYGLLRLADLRAGERVLIHSAAGGVGLAAVQLALNAGAEVFATAGNPRKRAYLRSLGIEHVMDSRTINFADDVLAITGGEGVNVVFNALTGDAIPAGLSVLAPGGRFLEIGKRELWTDEQVAEVNAAASYIFYDLADLALHDPAQIQTMLQELIAQFEEGTLQPLPMRVFPIERVREAYEYMARALHIGKVVVAQTVVPESHPDGWVRPDATYVITGGLGGLGLEVARGLVERGAGHLALISRRGPDAASATVDQLRAEGVAVEVFQADVAQADQLAGVFDDLARRMPPVRGIIHAAGLLRDGLLAHQTWELYEDVLAPKVKGAWNLHRQTYDLPLDFFVLFSSGSALLGSPGQSNYTAANAFMDALALRRRAAGLPALSVGWGPWTGVGMAAALSPQRRARIEESGIGFIRPEQGVAVLESLIGAGIVSPANVAVLPIDWNRVARAGADGPLYALLAEELEARQMEAPAASLVEDWLAALYRLTPGEQCEEVEAMLCRRVAEVLRLKPGAVDTTEPLVQLGLDSLMTVELRNAVGRQVGQTLPATVVFDYPTVEALRDYLVEEVLELGAEDRASGAQTNAPLGGDGDLAPTSLDDLSDQEIAALLDKKLDSLSFRE